MAQHIIPITNGNGSKELVNGNYNVVANVSGYDNSTILPETQEITEGIDSYSFTIAATGTLTLHVSDDGTDIGVPIQGATFYRCDAEGNTYGNLIESDVDGNAVFENVPYLDGEEGPTIYFKQVSSDGEHEFNQDLQNTTLAQETKTVEISNPEAVARTFTLTDVNYANLPIENGEITLSE